MANHKDIHDRLIEDFFRLNEGIASGKIMPMCDLEKFLTEWLVLHILIEDKK